MAVTSILLGAGFSKSDGYRDVRELNECFLRLKNDDFSIHTDGTLELNNQNLSSHNKYKPLFLKALKYYSLFRQFDYEAFYDFLKSSGRGINLIFKLYISILQRIYKIQFGYFDTISQLVKILNQLTFEFLMQPLNIKSQKPFLQKPIYTGYTGFLNTLEVLAQESIINVHTLNHDLVFEKLSNSDWINNNLSDGFTDYNSPFYGIDNANNHVPLEYFNNNYSKSIRLYKLHGSFDYYPYHLKSGQIDKYVKIKFGINNSSLFKQITNPAIEEVNDFGNFHSDFLSGTTDKIKRYKEPFFSLILDNFANNLRSSDRLIIIGYGCGDSGINKIIKENFISRHITIINPKPGPKVLKFSNEFRCRLVKKYINDISISDLY